MVADVDRLIREMSMSVAMENAGGVSMEVLTTSYTSKEFDCMAVLRMTN